MAMLNNQMVPKFDPSPAETLRGQHVRLEWPAGGLWELARDGNGRFCVRCVLTATSATSLYIQHTIYTIHIYIYIHMHICIYIVCIYIYIYIYMNNLHIYIAELISCRWSRWAIEAKCSGWAVCDFSTVIWHNVEIPCKQPTFTLLFRPCQSVSHPYHLVHETPMKNVHQNH